MSNAPVTRQPPQAPEGGWGWVAIPAAFIIHVITSGYMLSLSVFLVEWRLYFDTDAKTVGYVGVILGFLGPTMGLPAGGLSKTFGCRTVTIIAGLCLSISMLLTSFATKLYHLYLTTVLTAFLYDASGSYNISFFVGAAVLFMAALSMFTFWILHRRKETREVVETDQEVKMTEVTENGPKAEQCSISEEEEDGAGISNLHEKT